MEPQTPSDSLYSPSLALLRLLQTAFNRQGTVSQQQHAAPRPSSAWRKQQLSQGIFPTRFPAQKLYQALDLINKYRGPEDSLYSDYSDGFYNIKPYRHRDDRLLQALFEMLDDARK
ncbi:neuroendocrine convertase 1-like [Kryptolebias marmoratus]|nr:neuroendocrine convertase 1-like [Kryptolebias marmoratus]